MQILDSFIDGALCLGNEREADELIGMIARYLRTGSKPTPRTNIQRAYIIGIWPSLENSRVRMVSGSKGGSKQPSKQASKTVSKAASKQASKTVIKQTSEEEEEIDVPIGTSPPIAPHGGADSKAGGRAAGSPHAEIVEYLNAKTGSAYRAGSDATRQLINGRLAEGFTADDFKRVIDVKAAEWLEDAKMRQYLRPKTLFAKGNFEGYLNQKPPKAKGGEFDAYAD